MRRRYTVLCACVLAWLLCTGAAEEDRYASMCREHDVTQAHTTAWIEIPGAEFCRPVMRHDTDDAFYARHDADGTENRYGSLYMQAGYNAADFSDPVTIVYGSAKAEGAPLRDLQEIYSGRFDQCREILLHTPDETLRYEVFAAIPYSPIHILHYYDFTVESRYEGFFEDVFGTRRMGMHLDETGRPEFGEQVLILSTGVRGDDMQRYLVMAKRIDREG